MCTREIRIAVVVIAAFASSRAGFAQQHVSCALDLQNGRTGQMELSVTRPSLTGQITAQGNVTPVSGTWNAESIAFTRSLTGNSVQPFRGIAIVLADGKVKMAGRFAANFDGVWSGNCAIDQSTVSPPDTGTPTGRPPTDPPGPALTVRPNPFKPTASDRVTFIADAMHSSGVQEVTISVNGQPMQTCHASHCEFTGGPYTAGPLTWRASARAQDGGVTAGTDNTLTIAAGSAPQTATCSIAGSVTGPRASVAGVFGVMLMGPDSETTLRARQPLSSGSYRFTGLQNGRYVLIADTKADVDVHVTPSRQAVVCTGAAIAGINFDFR